MTAFDLQEQEQLDELKAFWARWGNTLMLVVVAAMLAYLGMHGWQWWQKSRGSAAADGFAEVKTAFDAKDATKTLAAAEKLAAEHGRSPLAGRAMLLAAKMAFDAKDLAGARKSLEWVLSHAGDDALKDVASLRLAAVMADLEQLDAAIAAVAKPRSTAFAALFADAKGDLLALKGDKAGAKAAYQDALVKIAASPSTKDVSLKRMLELKLSTLGA